MEGGYITEYDPVETDLDRFVKMDKDFIGRSSLLQTSSHPKRRRLITLELASSTVPAQPGDSVLCNGSVVGTVTSAGWGHRTNKNLAYAFVDGDARDGLSALVSATETPAEIKDQPLYGPAGAKVRA